MGYFGRYPYCSCLANGSGYPLQVLDAQTVVEASVGFPLLSLTRLAIILKIYLVKHGFE